MNPYDMRVKCAKPPLCYDFSNVATYLARPEVQAKLGVTGHKWADCDRGVALGFELDGDWMQSYQQLVRLRVRVRVRVSARAFGHSRCRFCTVIAILVDFFPLVGLPSSPSSDTRFLAW